MPLVGVSTTSTRRVAFLRAINVGRRRVEMARLRAIVEELGHDDVSTVRASGNVLFVPRAGSEVLDAGGGSSLERELEGAFAAALGYDVEAAVRASHDLASLLAAARTLERREGDSVHVVFLRTEPTADARATIEGWSTDGERLDVRGRDVLWQLAGGVSGSALTARHWTRIGHPEATSRNTTMLAEVLDRLG